MREILKSFTRRDCATLRNKSWEIRTWAHHSHKDSTLALRLNYITADELAFFASPLLYHNLPRVRTVTGPDGRRYTVADTGLNRRNTIAVVSNEHALADSSSFQAVPDAVYLRRSTLETVPAHNKGGTMSKVVRGVKNITKGYSSVQVKVRNGRLGDVGQFYNEC